MQCARTVLSSVACTALLYFSTLCHKRHDFRKHVTEYQMRVLIFSTTLCETFLIPRKTKPDMIETVYWSSCTVPVIPVRF
jgi:hypothetical protein